jgi:uncharacterized membrane protein
MEHILNSVFLNGYNLINSTIYTLVVCIGYFWFYKIIKWKFPFIVINKHFVYSVIPFVCLGSLLRILEQEYTGVWLITPSNSPLDLGFYFHTPGWLLLVAFLFIFFFMLSIYLSKNKSKYYNWLIFFGIFLCLPLFIYEIIHIKNIFVLTITIFTIIIIFFIFSWIFNRLNIKIFNQLENKLLFLSQITDFSATLSGMFFFSNLLYEQHPISRVVISFFPILYPIIKIFFILVFIIVVDRLIKESEERTYIKLLIIILGFLTGLRDLLTISLL